MFADTNRQLRKLSIYKPMQFRVTQIEFDWEDDGYVICDHEDPLQTLTIASSLVPVDLAAHIPL